MLALEEIEKKVLTLPKEEYFAFREWFHKYDAQKWDEEIKEDVNSGELDNLAQKALEDFDLGLCKEL